MGSSNAALSEFSGREALAPLLELWRAGGCSVTDSVGRGSSKFNQRTPGCPRQFFPAIANLPERIHDKIEGRGKFAHNVSNNLRFCAGRQVVTRIAGLVEWHIKERRFANRRRIREFGRFANRRSLLAMLCYDGFANEFATLGLRLRVAGRADRAAAARAVGTNPE